MTNVRLSAEEQATILHAIDIQMEGTVGLVANAAAFLRDAGLKEARRIVEDRLQIIVKERVAQMQPGKRYPIDELISPSNTYAREFEAALQKLVETNQLRKVENGVYSKAR